MSPTLVLSLVAGYFAVLIVIAILTSRGATSESFFVANRNAPWYMVAFAMIGTSLSGVTFISVPGNVYGKSWSYLAVVLGYVAGYVVIGTVLLPLYYRLRLVSIYTYLEQRFGYWSYKTGALKIQELRRRYEEQLGAHKDRLREKYPGQNRAHFHLADFHDELLRDGVMPLAVLERKMDNWAASQK